MEKLPQHILFMLFYRKTDCILKEQIVQYFLTRENLQANLHTNQRSCRFCIEKYSTRSND